MGSWPGCCSEKLRWIDDWESWEQGMAVCRDTSGFTLIAGEHTLTFRHLTSNGGV